MNDYITGNAFFLFSRDFVLAFSRLFFCRIIYSIRRRDFFGQREREREKSEVELGRESGKRCGEKE